MAFLKENETIQYYLDNTTLKYYPDIAYSVLIVGTPRRTYEPEERKRITWPKADYIPEVYRNKHVLDYRIINHADLAHLEFLIYDIEED